MSRFGQTRPRLSTGRKLLFSLTICTLVLATFELSCRLGYGWRRDWRDCHRWHETLGWSLRENWHGKYSWTGGQSHINAQGIRDDQDIGPKTPGEKRLLVLGDSVTFGALATTAEAFPAQIGQCLRSSGISWRVLNGGVTAYDPSQEADWLELFGWSLEPDVLAVVFCANDMNTARRSQSDVRRDAGGLSQWLTDHSLIAYRLQRLIWGSMARLGLAGVNKVPANSASDKARPVGWPFVEHEYRRIDAAARGRKVPVILMVFPTLEDADGHGKSETSQRLHAISRKLGWNIIDLAPAFAGDDATNLYLPGDPVHPNAQGYARAAHHAADSTVLRDALH